MEMDLKFEPDVIPNFIQSASKDDFGPNLIRLHVTNQIKELQTVIRDRLVENNRYTCLARATRVRYYAARQL